MFGFRYMKAPPTTYVIQHRAGRVVREGAGLSFFYFAPTTEISQVPLASADVPFAFNEVTADFQDATIQGQLTYRVSDAKRLAALLDLSVDAGGRYRGSDYDKLGERLVQAAQILARAFTQCRQLAEVLVASDAMVREVLAGLRASDAVAMLGVEILNLAVLSIKATPEMAKALQAGAREELLRKADEAVYARRNAAVELERQIKENELNTEIAVEQKKRQVRETQMQADIAVEGERMKLVERRIENDRKEAESRGLALRAVLEPIKEVDWRTLLAAGAGAASPKTLIAMAFRDLADNAAKIGRLDISPELLNALLAPDARE
jgi:hypothetical protein